MLHQCNKSTTKQWKTLSRNPPNKRIIPKHNALHTWSKYVEGVKMHISTGLYRFKNIWYRLSPIYESSPRVNNRMFSLRWRSGHLNSNLSWAGLIVCITNHNCPAHSSNQLKLIHRSNVFEGDCYSLHAATLSDAPPIKLLRASGF